MSPEVRDAMTPDDVVEALMKGNANDVAKTNVQMTMERILSRSIDLKPLSRKISPQSKRSPNRFSK